MLPQREVGTFADDILSPHAAVACALISNNTGMRNMMTAKTLACATLLSSMAALGTTGAEAGPLSRGKASWYGPGFQGRLTANGERFNTNAFTAAHKTLPFGTKVKVTNNKTGRSVVVRINDRGPYAHGRVIDLSKASARAIGISGVADITMSRL